MMGVEPTSKAVDQEKEPYRRCVHFGCVAFLTLLGGWIFFTGLEGSLSLWDEAYYAATAKKSLERGTILFPCVDPGGRADKTALHFWLLQLSFLLFGTNSFALRFPSSAGAFFSYLLVYLLGRRFYGERVGLVAALILLTNREFHIYPRNSLLDPPMLAFQLGFVWCLVQGQSAKPWHLALGGALLGLAFFQKQALGLAVIAPVLFYLAWSKDWPRASWKGWLLFSACFAIFGCGWYVLAAVYDPSHVKTLLFFHNLSFRFQVTGHGDDGFWLDHFTNLSRQGLNPILYMGGFCFIWSIVEWLRKPEAGLALFAFWLWSLTLALHLVSFRALQYSLPLYPLLALLAARMLDRLWTADWNGVDLFAFGWGTAFLLMHSHPGWLSSLGFGAQGGKCLIAGTVLAALFLPRWPFHWSVRGAAATMAVLAPIWVSAHVPMRADWGPEFPKAVEELEKKVGADGVLYSTVMPSFHLVWYHEGPTKVIYRDAENKIYTPEGEGYAFGMKGEFEEWPRNRFEQALDVGMFEVVRFFPAPGATPEPESSASLHGG